MAVSFISKILCSGAGARKAEQEINKKGSRDDAPCVQRAASAPPSRRFALASARVLRHEKPMNAAPSIAGICIIR